MAARKKSSVQDPVSRNGTQAFIGKILPISVLIVGVAFCSGSVAAGSFCSCVASVMESMAYLEIFLVDALTWVRLADETPATGIEISAPGSQKEVHYGLSR